MTSLAPESLFLHPSDPPADSWRGRFPNQFWHRVSSFPLDLIRQFRGRFSLGSARNFRRPRGKPLFGETPHITRRTRMLSSEKRTTTAFGNFLPDSYSTEE